MNTLKLNFIENREELTLKNNNLTLFEKILDDFGREISEYAKGIFYHSVANTSDERKEETASLYIIIPELGYDYRVISLSEKNPTTAIITLHSLGTKNITVEEITLSEKVIIEKITDFLSSQQVNDTFKFLVKSVKGETETEKTSIQGNNNVTGTIKSGENTIVGDNNKIQNHSGSGDNVGGDKIQNFNSRDSLPQKKIKALYEMVKTFLDEIIWSRNDNSKQPNFNTIQKIQLEIKNDSIFSALENEGRELEEELNNLIEIAKKSEKRGISKMDNDLSNFEQILKKMQSKLILLDSQN